MDFERISPTGYIVYTWDLLSVYTSRGVLGYQFSMESATVCFQLFRKKSSFQINKYRDPLDSIYSLHYLLNWIFYVLVKQNLYVNSTPTPPGLTAQTIMMSFTSTSVTSSFVPHNNSDIVICPWFQNMYAPHTCHTQNVLLMWSFLLSLC